MRKGWISLGFLLLSWLCVHGQEEALQDSTKTVNLVFNGSFEEFRACPKRVNATGVLSNVDCWYQPTLGSADYFNACGGKECGVPANKLGRQEAYDGDAYCGIYCSRNDYREYLQTRLRRKLHLGDSIRLSFYVSLSEESTGAVATIGALFTEERISDTVRSLFLYKEREELAENISQTVARPFEPQIVNPADRPLVDTRGWQCVCDTFVAKGGEQYITIGNFNIAERSGYVDLDTLTRLLPGAYYYIDSVSVECLNCPPPVVDDLNVDSVYLSNEQPVFGVGGTFVLQEIFFEYDKSTILQQSFFELMRLTSLMEKYPDMTIEVRGHTDAKGSDSYNLRLSENRAKSVVDYLVSKGVNPKRLKYKGYGKSIPIDTNETEEGRSKNRRVEFKIISM